MCPEWAQSRRENMKKEYPIDEEKLKKVCKRWHNGEITARQAQAAMDMPPRTFYTKVKARGLSKPGGIFNGYRSKQETRNN